MINFVVLGGTNDEKSDLNNFTKNRILKCNKILLTYKEKNEDITIHFLVDLTKSLTKPVLVIADICKNYLSELIKIIFNMIFDYTRKIIILLKKLFILVSF